MLLLRSSTVCQHARCFSRRIGAVPAPRAPPADLPRALACRFMLTKGAGELAKQSCEGACNRETPLVSAEDMAWLTKEVPRWQLTTDGKALSRKFTARNFMAAMGFFNKAAEVAEQAGHHPDFHLTNYRDVKVVVTTHAAGGLTHFDFVLAAKLDQIEVDYSPKWLREHPLPETE